MLFLLFLGLWIFLASTGAPGSAPIAIPDIGPEPLKICMWEREFGRSFWEKLKATMAISQNLTQVHSCSPMGSIDISKNQFNRESMMQLVFVFDYILLF